MQPWQQMGEPETTKVGWRTIVKKTFRDPDGSLVDCYTKDKVGTRCAAVIALSPENKVVVNEMFRPGPQIVMYEIPGGGSSDDDKSPKDAAIRELQEETGYTPGSVEYLGRVYKDAWGNAESHYYLARDCKHTSEQKLDKEEFINVKEITIDELIHNAKNGLMTDTEGVFLAYDKLKEIQGGMK